MSRSLTGNLIGSASHGFDDMTAEETPYAVKLKSALSKLKVIFDNPEGYLNWMLRKTQERDGIGMLEEAEIIIAQCELWDDEHPVDAAQSIEQAIDATLHAEDSSFKKLGGYVKPERNANGHTDAIQNAIDKGQLDANGQMLPYKASGVVGKSWDDHEVHSYTADGE